MDDEFSLWLCYVKLRVCYPDETDSQWNSIYCSIPARNLSDLIGFQNENLKIIAILNFHPMNCCAVAEIDEPEELNALTKVLMVEDNFFNFKLAAMFFIKKVNLVAYDGFDVETVMQIAANKLVDVIIVNARYGGKYKEVDWMKNIRMLKSNPETAQIPVILKLSNATLVGERERYLAESWADGAIRVGPGEINLLIEKIKHTLSGEVYNPDTTINNKKI